MSAQPSRVAKALKIGAAIAVVHAGICLFLSFTGWPDAEPYSFDSYRLKWPLKLLELPLFVFIHDPDASTGRRVVEVLANSAAAGLMLGVALSAWRGKRSASERAA